MTRLVARAGLARHVRSLLELPMMPPARTLRQFEQLSAMVNPQILFHRIRNGLRFGVAASALCAQVLPAQWRIVD
jgi:hypothetical protein